MHTTSRPRIESKQRTSHHRGERRGWSRMLMADAMLDPRRSSRAQIVYRHPATLFVSATTKEFRHPPPLRLNRTFSPRPLPPPSDDSSFGIIGCVSGLHLRRYRCYTPFGMLRNGRRPHLSLSLFSPPFDGLPSREIRFHDLIPGQCSFPLWKRIFSSTAPRDISLLILNS